MSSLSRSVVLALLFLYLIPSLYTQSFYTHSHEAHVLPPSHQLSSHLSPSYFSFPHIFILSHHVPLDISLNFPLFLFFFVPFSCCHSTRLLSLRFSATYAFLFPQYFPFFRSHSVYELSSFLFNNFSPSLSTLSTF